MWVTVFCMVPSYLSEDNREEETGSPCGLLALLRATYLQGDRSAPPLPRIAPSLAHHARDWGLEGHPIGLVARIHY